MQERTRVVYVGTDAQRVAERWESGDRAFALVGFDPEDGAPALGEEARVDGVVCRDRGDVDLGALVTATRGVSTLVPVVVLADDGGVDAETALAADVDHYVTVEDDAASVTHLSNLAGLVERHQERRREQSMLDSLLGNIPLSVYFKDRESRHLRVSDEMATMVGPEYIENAEGKRFHTAADVVGTTDFDLYTSEHATEAVADDETVLRTGEAIENRIEHSFGNEYDGTYVATSKAPWYDEHGDVVGIVGVTRDVSERRQYEARLERQNDRLERFAQVLSHDLRNPLGVARGRLELAREDGDDEHFDAVEAALARMDGLVDDVLTLARQGESVEDPSPVDLATVATDAWAVVDSGDAALDVETDLTVVAEPGRLRRLLENLLRNSIEHGAGAGAETAVTVTVGDLPQGRGFYVGDDGVGIPAEERESVFESGFSTADDGTGLGLNIVRTIADAHGWHVAVTESEDGGACFEFEDVEMES